MVKTFNLGLTGSIYESKEMDNEFYRETVSEFMEITSLPLDNIQANSSQPRKTFNDAALIELAESIKSQGVIQPIVVRPLTKDRYEIIVGERRWRAAQLAQLISIPAIIKTKVIDDDRLFMALIENLQREDLHPLEESEAFDKLIRDFSLTHDQIAKKVGKSRSEITNKLRLLNLTSQLKEMFQDNLISYGHAKMLVAQDEQIQLLVAEKIVEKQLSVRETEELIQRYKESKKPEEKKQIPTMYQEQAENLRTRIARCLSSKVKITINRKGKGKAMICFSSLEEIEWLAKKLEE